MWFKKYIEPIFKFFVRIFWSIYILEYWIEMCAMINKMDLNNVDKVRAHFRIEKCLWINMKMKVDYENVLGWKQHFCDLEIHKLCSVFQ